MEDKNVLDLLREIQELAKRCEVDGEKVIKSNKTAGVRLRKDMQKIKSLSQEIRDFVQENKKE